jgi:hypothetical protein
MNKIQLALLDLINSTVENIKKHDVGEILNWILRNQIAKYSLANDYYFTTQKTLDHIKNLGADVSNRNTKSKKNKITFEHPVPCKIIALELLKNPDKENIQNILNITDKVVILTHEENELFRKFKLNSKMPKDWRFGDDVFARYKIVGIEVLIKKIKMYGALKR